MKGGKVSFSMGLVGEAVLKGGGTRLPLSLRYRSHGKSQDKNLLGEKSTRAGQHLERNREKGKKVGTV